MIVLGVDPGSMRTGYGAVETDGRRHRLVEMGVLAPGQGLSLPEKLRHIHAGVFALIERLSPDVLAVEDVFHAANTRTALVLGHVRGVVLLAGAQAGLAVHEYPPATVKQQVTGFGRAEKSQVAFMVTRMLALPASRRAGRCDRRPRRRPLLRLPAARGRCALVIAQVRGRLVRKEPQEAVVDVGGVGYRVAIPLSTFYRIGEAGDEVTLLTHTHVREDTLALFGFLTPGEQALFERLIAVSGVGPKLALSILSGIEAPDLVSALRTSDVARLTRIPGVGKKTAERLVLELKDKVQNLSARRGARSRRTRRRHEGRPRLRPRAPGLLAARGRARRRPGPEGGPRGSLRGPPAPDPARALGTVD